MNINAAAIQASDKPSLRQAITDYFRENILRGDFVPGDSVPPTRELAALLDTSSPNIHHALTPLVQEGLVTRDRKRGTIVNARPRNLACVVIYLHHWKLDILPPFQHTLVGLIGKELDARGIEHRVVVDNFTQFGLQQIQDWAATGRIQGVIMPFAGADIDSIQALDRLPVASVIMGSNQRIGAPSQILPAQPLNQMAKGWHPLACKVVEALKRQGCCRAGLVSSLPRIYGEMESEHPFYTCFRKEAGDNGLEVREEWLATVASEKDYLATPGEKNQFAYDRCSELLALPDTDRPDGLFIFSDSLITGTLLAVYRQQIRVPDDLKLVLYRNWEIDAVGLPPCEMVGLSVLSIAQALIESIAAQFNGQKIPPAQLLYTTQPNKG